MSDEPLEASVGWGVVHLFYRVDRARADDEPGSAKHVLEAIDRLTADDTHQVLTFAALGHKADLGVMAVGPDLARLQTFEQDLARAPLVPTWSYVSLTEQYEYAATEEDERARLASDEGVTDPDELDTRLAVWRDRIEHYREQRIHPHLPARRAICFYPMSKRRSGPDNWFALDFDDRKRLMAGHARVGRSYAGRVLQLITGSTGLDDWEWGVTLFADDPAALKEIVYEMRFDEVSARYAEFGPFVTGLILEPVEALRRVGLDA
ncbi:MAG TPA: chlorite dismutase family protein [Acidimicrobiia bacterium]